MATTYTPIATTTLGSAQSSVTFSSISGTYTDLVLVCQTAASASTTYLQLRINGDTGTNYSLTTLKGDGTSAVSQRYSNQSYIFAAQGSPITTTLGNQMEILHFMNYSNTTTYKTVLGRESSAGTEVDAVVNLWRNTNAITSLVISLGSGNLVTGSTFTLYGIKAA